MKHCPTLCYLSSFCFSGFLLFVGVFTLTELRRYDPLYTPVQCQEPIISLPDVSITPALKVKLEIRVTCMNPNPYDVFVTQSATLTVYLRRSSGEIQDFGEARFSRTFFPASDDGLSTNSTIVIISEFSAGVLDTISLLLNELRKPSDVYFEVKAIVDAEGSFLALKGAISHQETVDMLCGLQIKLLPDQETGVIACGQDFDAIEMLPLESTSGPSSSGPSSSDPSGDDASGVEITLPSDDIDKAEGKRDLIGGIVVAVSLALGVLSLLWPVCYCALRRFAQASLVVPSKVEPTVVGGSYPC
eukprot:TRINITY_DN37966_c0_g1_i1.p1 TRINITY_DN37966_c0_g1~~TRINITY_DN37966_c0_g1_i1.p1  ORF type:complete len:302 (+),score=23.65 TRINITY_DN37966_c0_g1_i1:106-1011(+)